MGGRLFHKYFFGFEYFGRIKEKGGIIGKKDLGSFFCLSPYWRNGAGERKKDFNIFKWNFYNRRNKENESY